MTMLSNLRRGARRNPIVAQQLRALEITLSHFGVVNGSRDKVADALLRFRVIKDHDMALDRSDPLLNQLIRMDEYFTALVGGKQCACA